MQLQAHDIETICRILLWVIFLLVCWGVYRVRGMIKEPVSMPMFAIVALFSGGTAATLAYWAFQWKGWMS
ncbi:MAG: hypothetical protein WAV73_00710 [Candidatus Moraniibacteriota bacterium]